MSRTPNFQTQKIFQVSSAFEQLTAKELTQKTPFNLITSLSKSLHQSSPKSSLAVTTSIAAEVIAPNCTVGSSARIRDVCEFCVACCNDFCPADAVING